MHHLGNRFIGLSASGEFPGAGVLTATVALKAASSGLQFSSVHTWLSCKSPRSKGASANGNLQQTGTCTITFIGHPVPAYQYLSLSVCRKKRSALSYRRPDCQVPGYQTVLARGPLLGCIRVVSTP
jgi:hypothetical protein